jgi:predicted MPP superfamily phosphohydrolase
MGTVLSRGTPGIFSRTLEIAGNYIVPFFLYLFLFVLLFDLWLLIDFIFKIQTREQRKNPRFKRAALSVIIGLSALVVISGIINFNTIRTTEYHIDIPRKSSKTDHLKIAYVSDFHLEEETSIRFVRKFVERIKMIQPDIMFFGGDIVEGDREGENMSSIEDILSGIKTKYGVYGVLGNHEHYGRQDKGSFFDKAGIKILTDTSLVIDSVFNLAGRNDNHFRNRKSLADVVKTANTGLPLILLNHRPIPIDSINNSNADVLISGHTHNGQLFPINFIVKKIYDISDGYRKVNNTHVFVSSGIRLWGPPVRTVGKSEILVLDIRFIP